jgi:cell division protein FtsW
MRTIERPQPSARPTTKRPTPKRALGKRPTTTRLGGDDSTEAIAVRRARADHPTARPRRKPRKPPAPLQYWGILAIITILVAIGLIMVLSASSVMALHQDGSGWVYFEKQVAWAALGVLALAITSRVPYHVWRKLVPVALLGSFSLMVVVLMPGFGRVVNGARAWIAVGPFAIQPSELLKITLLVYSADLLARRADRLTDWRSTLRPLLVVLGLASVLLMAQPDLGGAIVLASIVLGVAFIGGIPATPLALTTGGIAVTGTFFVLQTPYRRDRWLAFLDLAKHKKDTGWQVWQSLIGIASGGVTGVGPGAGKAKWGFLPEAHTDFIFAVIAEELGLVGAAAVCLLFLAFALLGVQIALRAPDRFGMLLAGGITAWVLVQAVINIGGVVGLMPLTGLTLPFVSFGGSSLLVTMAAGGLLLNVARASR